MPLAPWPVALPLLGAALLAGLGPRLPRLVADGIGLLVSAATTACCLGLMLLSRHAPIVYWFGGIRPRQGVALGIDFAIDPIGAGFAALGGALVFCALLFAVRWFDEAQALFQSLMLVFLGGLCGFALTGDLFDLFVFFELMGAAAFGLCGYKSREVGPLQGAINFAVTNTAGAFLTLTGIALLYARTGALNLSQIARAACGPGAHGPALRGNRHLRGGRDPLLRAAPPQADAGLLHHQPRRRDAAGDRVARRARSGRRRALRRRARRGEGVVVPLRGN